MYDYTNFANSIIEKDVPFVKYHTKGGYFIDVWDKYQQQRLDYNENRDCSVRAFAEAFNTTYEKAHKHLKEKMGRITGQGIYFEKVFEESLVNTKVEKLTFKGNVKDGKYKYLYENNKPSESSCGRITLGKFVEEYGHTGNWIVLVKGHALAVKNGVVYDHTYKPRRHVKFAYRIER